MGAQAAIGCPSSHRVPGHGDAPGTAGDAAQMAKCHSSVPGCWAGQGRTRREQLALGAGGGEAMAQVTEAVKQVELANSSLFCLQAALCAWLNALLVLL